MTLEDSINNIKRKIEEDIKDLTDEELKAWVEPREDKKIMPVMTKWSLMNPNECYVTHEEYDKLKPGRVFIENGKPSNKG